MSEDKPPEIVIRRQVAGEANAGKKDPASDSGYDKSKPAQKLDQEIRLRRRNGRWMSATAVILMGIFILGFFGLATCFAWRFFHLYIDHLSSMGAAGGSESSASMPTDSILPFIVPMMPAFFFSLLGLVTLITCTRFITSYVNAMFDDEDDANLVERVAREIAGIIKAWKSGGS